MGQTHGLTFDTEPAWGYNKPLVAGSQLALPPEQGCPWPSVDGVIGYALVQCNIRHGPQVLASLVLNRSNKTEFSEQGHGAPESHRTILLQLTGALLLCQPPALCKKWSSLGGQASSQDSSSFFPSSPVSLLPPISAPWLSWSSGFSLYSRVREEQQNGAVLEDSLESMEADTMASLCSQVRGPIHICGHFPFLRTSTFWMSDGIGPASGSLSAQVQQT